MANSSFDVESTVDFQEFRNAVQQASKEVVNRYDLKRAQAKVELQGETLILESGDEFSLSQTLDIVKGRVVRRGIDVKSLIIGDPHSSAGARYRQEVTLQQGIPTDTCKKIVASIKKLKMKVQASIQGDSVRVSGKKLDDLQAVMAHLKELDLDVPLRFTNYR